MSVGACLDVVETCCRSLNGLTQEKATRAEIGSDALCQVMMDALISQSGSTSTVVRIILALGSLSHEAPHTGHRLAELGICAVLQSLHKQYPDNDELAWGICRLSSYLSAERTFLEKDQIYLLIVGILRARVTTDSISEVAVSTVTTSSATKKSTETTIEWACRCIGYLACDEASKRLLGQCGACETVADTIEVYLPKSSYVTREGILALSCLFEEAGNIDRPAMKDRAGRLVTLAIQTYFSDTEIAWTSCKLFISLAQRPEYLLSITPPAGDYVISTMQNHYKSSLVTDWGCRALSSLSADETYRDLLVGKNACDAIVQALRAAVSGDSLLSFVVQRLSVIPSMNSTLSQVSQHLTKSALAASACNSIFSLADTHDEYRRRLGNAGACESVVKVLVKFTDSPDVAAAACLSIVSLCRGTPAHRENFGVSGALKGIIMIIQKYPTDEELSYQACCALIALIADPAYIECCGELSNTKSRVRRLEDDVNNRHSLIRYGDNDTDPNPAAVTSPTTIPATNSNSNGNASEIGTTVIIDEGSTQALEICERNILKFGTPEGCDAIAMALQTHQSSERLARVGCWSVALLAGSRNTSMMVRLGTAGACEGVVTMLQRHQKLPSVCQPGCIALARLGVNSGNSGWLGAAGGCTVVLDAVKRHPADRGVGRAGWAAISSLACDEGNRSRFGLLLVCDVVCNVINACIEEFQASKEAKVDLALFYVCEESCTAVSNLSRDTDNLKRFYDIGAPDIIIKTFQIRGMTAGLVANAADCVSSLIAGTEAGRSLLGEKGACTAIVKALEAHVSDPFVAVQCSLAVHSLCHRHRINQERVGAAGGCEVR